MSSAPLTGIGDPDSAQASEANGGDGEQRPEADSQWLRLTTYRKDLAMGVDDVRAVRVLYEQLHVIRAQADAVEPKQGSGVSVLIPAFNKLMERAKVLLQDDPVLLGSVADVTLVPEIQERVSAEYHARARQAVLLGSNLVLQALGQRLLPPAGPPVRVQREGLFVAGQHFDALELAREIVSQAQRSLDIIDGYIDHHLLSLLTAKRKGVAVRVLTKPRGVPTEVLTLAAAFNRQYEGSVSIRATEAFHDRFVIVDEDGEFFHFGASLKDLGSRGCMFSRIEEPLVMKALQACFAGEWERAKVVV